MNVNWFMQHISYCILRECVFIYTHSTSTSIEYLNIFFFSFSLFSRVEAVQQTRTDERCTCFIEIAMLKKRNKNQVMNALRCFSFTHLAVSLFLFYYYCVHPTREPWKWDERKREVLNVAKCRINLLRVLDFYIITIWIEFFFL